MLLGPEMKRKLKLRNLPNEELLRLYDSELVSRLHNANDLSDTRKMVRRFLESLNGYPPSAMLGKAFLAQFSHLKPRSLARYSKMVGSFLKWYGETWDYKVRIPRELPQYVEDEQVEKLFTAIKNKRSHKGCIVRDSLLVELALKSGMRRAELASLEAKDIHADFLLVKQGKNKKDRLIPLPPDIALRLNNFVKGKDPDSKVFGLKAPCIANKIRLFSKKAGTNGIHTHSLRSKYACDLLEHNIDVRTVQQLLGHENLSTTQIYLPITDKRLREAANVLEAKTKPQTTETYTGFS